jgi:ABC-type sulfate transport system permease component
MRQTIRSPLAWLGGLLVLYLTIPIGAFFIRLGRSNQRGFGVPGLWNALWVSLVTATITTILLALFGVPLAHVLSRAKGRLGTLVGIAVQLPLALPPLMSGILLIYLVGPYPTIGRLFDGRLTESIAGIVLAQTFVSAPFLIIAARSAFSSLDPALDDVAATLGYHPLARFLRVSVPATASAIVAGLLLTWLRAFGEYGATVLISYHPYTLPVFTEVQFSGSGLARNPRLVLLDEPFSALDAPVRDELRRELRRLQHEAGLSTVLVTHDPEEAALLADEVIVIAEGRLLQAGSIHDVYARPSSPQIARLVGMQNLNHGVAQTSTDLLTGGVVISTGSHGMPHGSDVLWSIRPEHVALSRSGRYPVEIFDIADLGGTTTAIVGLGRSVELRVRATGPVDLAVGSPSHVDLDPDAITVWPAVSLSEPRAVPVSAP